MKKTVFYLAFLFFVLLLSTSHPCFAHKVRIFAWENGEGTIMTESKFSGGRPAKNATVSVIETATGKKLLAGKTDDQGMYQFAIPKITGNALEIVVNGGDGHKNSWHYTLDDAPAVPPADNTVVQKNSQQQTSKQQTAQAPAVSSGVGSCNAENLTRLIDASLDRKLAPIKRVLAESTDRSPTLQDILGGIGYILGLAGIAAYFQSRKHNQE